jgi:HAD superfamily hydrolase (TIGR01509 family)
MIEAVLFSWDVTLVASAELSLRSLQQTTSEFLGANYPATIEEFAVLLPMQMAEVLLTVTGDRALSETMEARYREIYAEIRDEHLRVVPGAPEVLAELRARDIAVGAVTMKSRDRAESDARFCGLFPMLNALITAEDSHERSPHPEPLQAAMTALGAEPANTLFVSYAPLDIIAGQAAGTRTIGALYSFFDEQAVIACRPDYVIRSLPELIPIVDRVRDAFAEETSLGS